MDIEKLQKQLHKTAVEIQNYAQKLADVDPKHSYIERLNLASQMTSQAINHLGHLLALIDKENELKEAGIESRKNSGNV